MADEYSPYTDEDIVGYHMDTNDFSLLLRAEKWLHDDKPLTYDTRRDLANLVSLIRCSVQNNAVDEDGAYIWSKIVAASYRATKGE